MADDVPLRDAAQALLDASDRCDQQIRDDSRVSTPDGAALRMRENFTRRDEAKRALRAALAAADTAPTGERWFTLPSGALLYGDGTGGITVAGLDAWKDCAERTAAIRALARWCDEAIASATELAAADGTTPTQPDEVLAGIVRRFLDGWAPMPFASDEVRWCREGRTEDRPDVIRSWEPMTVAEAAAIDRVRVVATPATDTP